MVIRVSKIDTLNIGATTIAFIVLLVVDVAFNYVSEVKHETD